MISIENYFQILNLNNFFSIKDTNDYESSCLKDSKNIIYFIIQYIEKNIQPPKKDYFFGLWGPFTQKLCI